MSETTYDVPAVVIREYFKRFDLPLVMSLDNMPPKDVMRKVRFRAAQLEERWNDLNVNRTLAELLEPSGKIIVTKNHHLKVVAEDYDLNSGETLLGSSALLASEHVSIEQLRVELDAILAPRFTTIEQSAQLVITTTTENRREASHDFFHAEFGSRYRQDFYSSNKMEIGSAKTMMKVAKSIANNATTYYRAILKSGMAITYAKPIPHHDTSANLEKYLGERKRSIKWEVVHHEEIESLPIAEHGTKSSRTWGIEVESGGARGIGAPKGWGRKYDGSLYSAYDDYDGNEDFDEYNESSDGDTGEFVSPILHSFHSKGLESLLVKINTQPQNDSAGIHVHVGALDLTARQIGGLVFAYEMVEPFIESSYRRETREYCKNRPISETIGILKASKVTKYKTYNEFSTSEDFDYNRDRYSSNSENKFIPAGDRYVSLNLHSLDSHGTVEFRAMGPVYEYEHLIKWAHFCREMVNLAARDVPSREWSAIKSFADVRTLFAKYGIETPAILFGEMLDTRLVESYADSNVEV